MTRTVPDPEWELLRAIDPVRGQNPAALLPQHHREDLFSSIIQSDREPAKRREHTGPTDRHPRLYATDDPRTGRRGVWAAVGGSVTALVGGIVAALLLLSSGTPATAYAGWMAVPTTPTHTALTAAINACKTSPAARVPAASGPVTNARPESRIFKRPPVLSDARGRYVALISLTDGMTNACITAGPAGALEFHSTTPATPGPDMLSAPQLGGGAAPGFAGATKHPLPPIVQATIRTFQSREQALNNSPRGNAKELARIGAVIAFLSHEGFEVHAFGRAGSDVSAVTFAFADGETVQATIQNGWYFAWWPYGGPGDEPTSARVATSSGVTTSPLPGPQCTRQASSCAFR